MCVSLGETGLNEDICFHPGNAGMGSTLPVQETISSHLLSADCSGRYERAHSAICPKQGVSRVTSLSPSREREGDENSGCLDAVSYSVLLRRDTHTQKM